MLELEFGSCGGGGGRGGPQNAGSLEPWNPGTLEPWKSEKGSGTRIFTNLKALKFFSNTCIFGLRCSLKRLTKVLFGLVCLYFLMFGGERGRDGVPKRTCQAFPSHFFWVSSACFDV